MIKNSASSVLLVNLCIKVTWVPFDQKNEIATAHTLALFKDAWALFDCEIGKLGFACKPFYQSCVYQLIVFAIKLIFIGNRATLVMLVVNIFYRIAWVHFDCEITQAACKPLYQSCVSSCWLWIKQIRHENWPSLALSPRKSCELILLWGALTFLWGKPERGRINLASKSCESILIGWTQPCWLTVSFLNRICSLWSGIRWAGLDLSNFVFSYLQVESTQTDI